MNYLRMAGGLLAKIGLFAALIGLWYFAIGAINPEIEDARFFRNSGYTMLENGRSEVFLPRPYHDVNTYVPVVSVDDTSYARARLSVHRVSGESFIIKADSQYVAVRVNWATLGVADSLGKRR